MEQGGFPVIKGISWYFVNKLKVLRDTAHFFGPHCPASTVYNEILTKHTGKTAKAQIINDW